MKKYDAYLVGNYGLKNSADDALLAAALWGCEHYLNIKDVLIANAGQLSAKRFGSRPTNVIHQQLIPGQNKFNHFINATQCKRVIFGGGAAFNSYHDINLNRILMRLTGRANAMAIGIGLEPFRDTRSELACRKFLRECGLVTVRDQLSYDIATLIAPDANVYRAADLAPCLLRHPDYHPRESRKHGVLFNISPLVSRNFHNNTVDNQDYLHHIANVMETVWLLTKMPVTFISLDEEKQHGDNQCALKLKDILGDRVPVSFIPYHPDPLHVMQTVSEFKLMVGMRLHANIFAYLTETPCINIGAERSSFEWSSQVKLSKDYQFDMSNLDQPGLIKCILDVLQSGATGIGMKTNEAVLTALDNWRFAYEHSQGNDGLTGLQLSRVQV
jgi:polysaccharide pyruvyl transferase WcaK-like protein